MRHPPSVEIDPLDEARYHHGDLRRTLVAAALALLTETQDWGFSLREVARRAGVSHTAPYNHFHSKQDLLAAVAASGYDLLRVRMQEAAVPADGAAATLKAIGVAYVRFGVEHPAHYRLMFGPALTVGKSGELPPVTAEAAAGAKALLSGVIRQGASDGSFQIAGDAQAVEGAALAAWSLVHGLTMLLIDGFAGTGAAANPAAAEQIAGHVSQLLLDGLAVSYLA